MSDLPRDAYATYIRTRTQTIDPGYGPVSLSQAGILSKQAVSTGTLFHVLNLADVLLFSPRRPSRFRHTEHRPPSFTARWSSTVTHNVERLRQLLMSNTATADGPRDKMCQSTVLQQL